MSCSCELRVPFCRFSPHLIFNPFSQFSLAIDNVSVGGNLTPVGICASNIVVLHYWVHLACTHAPPPEDRGEIHTTS